MISWTFCKNFILYFRQILLFFLPPSFWDGIQSLHKRHYKFQTDILQPFLEQVTEIHYETVRVGIQSLQTGIKSLQKTASNPYKTALNPYNKWFLLSRWNQTSFTNIYFIIRIMIFHFLTTKLSFIKWIHEPFVWNPFYIFDKSYYFFSPPSFWDGIQSLHKRHYKFQTDILQNTQQVWLILLTRQ